MQMQFSPFPDHRIPLTRVEVMGILNTTPDSFSDGGQFSQLSNAIDHAAAMVAAGASIIDVGGESTRPGAQPATEAQELERVVPVIEALKQRFDCLISIDTSKAAVMTAAVEAGAGLINDVCALQQPGALAAAVALDVPVCLMHMQGEPRTMQHDPQYNDVVDDVYAFLDQRMQQCIAAGIAKDALLVDPGFGFGKTGPHNYRLLNQLNRLQSLGAPILVGMSRKRMIGDLLQCPVEERTLGSVAAAVIAATQGAHIVRVHDVRETVQAMAVVNAAFKEI